MASTVNLEQLEELATQLPLAERLQLVAYICQQLSTALLAEPAAESSEERRRQEQLAKLEAWLAECDKVAELWEGEFDAATDVRRMRNER